MTPEHKAHLTLALSPLSLLCHVKLKHCEEHLLMGSFF